MQIRAIGSLAVAALVVVVGVGAAFASPAVAPVTVKTAKIATFGNVLVNAKGLTLYRYTDDGKGKSMCSGACAAYWPPLLAPAGAKLLAGTGVTASKLGMIKRSNGEMQVTYAGYPLYLFAADKKSGQAKGQGYEKTWYVVAASSGAMVKTATAAAAASSSTPAPAPATTTPASSSSGGYNY